jgi:hypothetical protein
LVADLYVKPDGASMGERVHPGLEEGFTVVRGRLGYRVDGREGVAGPGQHQHVPHGTTHDWWNVGEEEVMILVEVSPAARFEEMSKNLFGLAQDGKTDAKGRPRLLQAALFAQEFDDVIRLTNPPRSVQRLLLGALAPIARMLGYRGSYPEYLRRPPREVVEVEPWRDFSAWPPSTDRRKEVDEEAKGRAWGSRVVTKRERIVRSTAAS